MGTTAAKTKATPKHSVIVSDQLWDELGEHASKRGVGRAFLVERAIEYFLTDLIPIEDVQLTRTAR